MNVEGVYTAVCNVYDPILMWRAKTLVVPDTIYTKRLTDLLASWRERS